MSDTLESIMYKIVIDAIEIINVLLFYTFDTKGAITPELRADFKEFSETLRQVFEKKPGAFTFDEVYLIIPKNTWIPIFHKHYCEIVGDPQKREGA